jgi:hypothetical protein
MENELLGTAAEIPGLGAAHNAGPRAHYISGGSSGTLPLQDYVRVARDTSRIDVKRGDSFLQADAIGT